MPQKDIYLENQDHCVYNLIIQLFFEREQYIWDRFVLIIQRQKGM